MNFCLFKMLRVMVFKFLFESNKISPQQRCHNIVATSGDSLYQRFQPVRNKNFAKSIHNIIGTLWNKTLRTLYHCTTNIRSRSQSCKDPECFKLLSQQILVDYLESCICRQLILKTLFWKLSLAWKYLALACRLCM